MRGILKQIVSSKRIEINELIEKAPIESLKLKAGFNRTPLSMKAAILKGSGVIAEFKRASPSKGVIRANADVTSITRQYQEAGASAISVLTDNKFFQGSTEDLIVARKAVNIPILRKDFIISDYQIFEAKSIGADCILLIAAILSKEEIKNFHFIASELGLEVLVEIHTIAELDKLSGNERLIGVNNRNLDTFEVDIDNSLRVAGQLREGIKIAESGLGAESHLTLLKSAGFQGFLVGENFMKQADPGLACKAFIDQLNRN